MGRAGRKAEEMLLGEDPLSQVLVTLEPETDYLEATAAEALRELVLRLGETKRDATSGQPSKSGEYLLQENKEFVLFDPWSDAPEQDRSARLCLALGESGQVEILCKAQDRGKQKAIYQGLDLDNAFVSLQRWQPLPAGAVSLQRHLASLLEKYPTD